MNKAKTVATREDHPYRLAAIKLTEPRSGWMWPPDATAGCDGWMRPLLRTRCWTVERFFAGLVPTGFGANLVINAARLTRLNTVNT